MRIMKKQKVCLTSLLVYIKEIMTENDFSSTFFLRFMTSLNSKSHLCECSDCHLFCSQQSDVFILAADSSVSPDLIHYFNSDFIFTEYKVCCLQNAVTNSKISINTLQNVVKYY